jgi:hypothetical protein
MTIAEAAIAARLASDGLGTVGTSIFVNTKPATPDNLIAVFGYGGSPPDRTHDTSGNARPGIQVWVRNTSAGTGRTVIENAFNNLDGITNTTLSGVFFLSVLANQSPEPMGKDENGRSEYAVNFSTIVRR